MIDHLLFRFSLGLCRSYVVFLCYFLRQINVFIIRLEIDWQNCSLMKIAMCIDCIMSETLQALYSELTTTLDARVVAANMYQRNALTMNELERIQSLRDRPVEAAEALLNIIMEQPDAVFLCFLKVLKCSKQEHIYERLVERGYGGQNHIFATFQY